MFRLSAGWLHLHCIKSTASETGYTLWQSQSRYLEDQWLSLDTWHNSRPPHPSHNTCTALRSESESTCSVYDHQIHSLIYTQQSSLMSLFVIISSSVGDWLPSIKWHITLAEEKQQLIYVVVSRVRRLSVSTDIIVGQPWRYKCVMA